MSLLSRGLSFAPATHFDLFGTILDVNRFTRNITIKKHFLHNCDDSMVDDGLASDTVHTDPLSDTIFIADYASCEQTDENIYNAVSPTLSYNLDNLSVHSEVSDDMSLCQGNNAALDFTDLVAISNL